MRVATSGKRAAGIERIRAAIEARGKVMADEPRSPDDAIRDQLQSRVNRLYTMWMMHVVTRGASRFNRHSHRAVTPTTR